MSAGSLPGFALLIGPDLQVVEMSESAAAFLSGRTLDQATDPSSAQKLRLGVEKARSGESLGAWEVTLYRDDEDHVFLMDMGPSADGVLITGADVSPFVTTASVAGMAAITIDDAFERARALLVEFSQQDEEARQALVTALHDDAIQPLVAAQLRLGDAAPEAAEQLGAAVDRLRRMVESTRPFPLAEGHLWPALRDLVRRHDSLFEGDDGQDVEEPDASVLYRAAERFLRQLAPGARIAAAAAGFDIRSRDPHKTPSRRFLRREADVMTALGGSVHELPGLWQVRLRRLSAGHPDQRRFHRGTMGTHDGGSQ